VRASAFDTSGFQKTNVFSVAITLAVGALEDVSFMTGCFEFDLTLLLGAGLRSTKNDLSDLVKEL
jgi:hypothetical protein